MVLSNGFIYRSIVNSFLESTQPKKGEARISKQRLLPTSFLGLKGFPAESANNTRAHFPDRYSAQRPFSAAQRERAPPKRQSPEEGPPGLHGPQSESR
mmetsp:Transcript_15876/g.21122  ORF Transcript_15876/g.21122 Transcript_15876/m.21122 type:complete len:98 (-) Transcript_15876:908-1201(-)